MGGVSLFSSLELRKNNGPLTSFQRPFFFSWRSGQVRPLGEAALVLELFGD
jgi:hypothetical protein